MSIINLEKTFGSGQLVYCDLNNKIIECTCLSELYKYSIKDYYNEYLGIFTCYKVKVITIYDIYKNIFYEPIQTNLFKDPIKIGDILENLIGRIKFFKTFIGVFIKNNKLNGIEYYTDNKGILYKFLYDNVELMINSSIKFFNIYDNEGKRTYAVQYKKHFINYKKYNDLFEYHIRDNNIKITKEKFLFHETIYCHKKNLKILQIYKYHGDIENTYEKRNDNNEITYLDEYNGNVLKEVFNSNDINPPFSKPLKKSCIELIDYYKKNINNYTELIKSCFKKEKKVHNNLLLNYKLEMINSK